MWAICCFGMALEWRIVVRTSLVAGGRVLDGGTDTRTPVSDIKHFEYAYQNERRVVWEPTAAEQVLEPILVEVDPMHEYATLIVL